MQALVSRGLEYVSGTYELPLGYAGTRMNIGGAVTNYEVKVGGLSSLEAKGDSYSYRLGVKHPMVRSLYSNLLLNATLEAPNSTDYVLGFEIFDKQYRSFTLGLKGDHSDSFSLGGTFWGGVSLTVGDLDLNNRDDLAADKLTVCTDGGYNKLNFFLGRQQILVEKFIAKALLSGQLADTNLGSFEKFSLGGPSGLGGFYRGRSCR